MKKIGDPRKLSPLERDVLNLLVENSGRIVLHDEINQTVWGYEGNDKCPLWSVASRLRKKLKGSEGEVETVFGQGLRYRK